MASKQQTASPMPHPVQNPLLPLTHYKVLSFDVYGTLIQYKLYILQSFQPLISRLPESSPYRDNTPLVSTTSSSSEDNDDDNDKITVGSIEFLKLFQKAEDKIKLEKPVPQFDEILAEIWRRVARDIGVETTEDEALGFGSAANIASWPCFPGTIEALQSLSRRYKLVALSNIDKYAWSVTCESELSPLGEVDWWKVFTAEDFGDDPANADAAKLETLLEYVTTETGAAKKDEVLHVAQSLGHDHAPAMKLGISSCFLIGDGPKWGKEAEHKMALEKKKVAYAFRCIDLREFAGLVEDDFKEGAGT